MHLSRPDVPDIACFLAYGLTRGDDRRVERDLRLLLQRVAPADLGARLRAARTAAGLKQSEVVGEDASVAYLSRIESGQRKPDLSLLTKMSERLGVTVPALLSGTSGDQRAEDRLQLDYAELALRTGEPAQAASLADDLVERYAGTIDLEMQVGARKVRAAAREALRDRNGAIDDLEALADDEDLPLAELAPVATSLVRCFREAGDLSTAITVGEKAHARLLDAGLGSGDETLELVSTIASAYFERGDAFYAVRLLTKASSQAEEGGSPAGRAAVYWNRSVMQSEQGDTWGALSLARRALTLLREADRLGNEPRLRAQIATMQLELDPPQVEDAVRTLDEVLREFEVLGASGPDRARLAFQLARAHSISGDLVAARRHADEARILSHEVDPVQEAEAHALLGRLDTVEDQHDSARSHYQQAALALALAGEDLDRHAAHLWFDLADMLESVGATREAMDAYKRGAAATGHRTGPVPTKEAAATSLTF